jgi:fused signal recognition particle receptor
MLTKDEEETKLRLNPDGTTVILMVGVNGVGKTTTIGKLANRFKQEGKSVLLAAGDTFRAGAIDQLEVWGKRAGVDVIKHQEGSDPAAVIYDALQAAKSRKVDVLICDTAGRLQNKVNLMKELEKVKRVISREFPGAPHEVLLALDATTGQNALSQAKEFGKATDVTGIVLTKLDGTAKGGIVFAIRHELDLPVKFVTLGEGIDDIQPFDADAFVYGLFSEMMTEAGGDAE